MSTAYVIVNLICTVMLVGSVPAAYYLGMIDGRCGKPFSRQGGDR